MNPNVAVSIVICTRDRAEKLEPTLVSLDGLASDGGPSYEIVCVDNNSRDATSHVVREFKTKSRVPLTYVLEPRTGLANARNTGVRHSRGEIIAMTDDDCIVSEDWLQILFEKFGSRARLGLVGGRVELQNPLDLPITIRTSRRKQNFTPESLDLILGCNMAFRRSAFDRVKGFDNLLGAGAPLKSGEDIDFVYRVHRQGYEVLYCPDLCVHHDHGRRTAEAALKLRTGYIHGRGAFYSKMILKFDKDVCRIAYWEIVSLMRELGTPGSDNSGNHQTAGKAIGTLIGGALAYPWHKTGQFFREINSDK